LYIGVSDWPGWEVAEANTTAELRGWTSFVALQSRYNMVERTPESDLVPMAVEQQRRAGAGAGPAGAFVTDPQGEVLAQPGVHGDLAVAAALAGPHGDQALAGRQLYVGQVQGDGLAEAQPGVKRQQGDHPVAGTASARRRAASG
jgi:hypothetical protein